MEKRVIQKSVVVEAPVGEIWRAFTTVEGVMAFFAPEAWVELAIGGPYELYFSPEAPAGSRGGEGLRILSYLPQEMLSFEWNAPPHLGQVRGERTWVVLQFEPMAAMETRVKLTHLGWGEGAAWDQAFAYFQRAWDVVLGRLVYCFAVGPIDWTHPYTPE